MKTSAFVALANLRYINALNNNNNNNNEYLLHSQPLPEYQLWQIDPRDVMIKLGVIKWPRLSFKRRSWQLLSSEFNRRVSLVYHTQRPPE